MKFLIKRSVASKVSAIIICLIIVITCQLPVYSSYDVPLKEKFKYGSENDGVPIYERENEYTEYFNLLGEYERNGYRSAKGSSITIDINDIKVPEGKSATTEKILGEKGEPVLIWDENLPWIELQFKADFEGLYEVEVEYYMLPVSGNPAIRSLLVDGVVPFAEANNITFYRKWKDKGEPVLNSIGDETRPGQVEVNSWKSIKIGDSMGLYPEPFRFYFKPGNHVIRLEFIEQQMAISNIIIKPAKEIPMYSQVNEQYKKNKYEMADQTIKFQAESTAVEKNDPTIRRESNADPLCEPTSASNRKLNVIGDYRWRKGNQSITWEFNVPKDGLYKIGIRVAQSWNDGLPSHRQISIDGEIPFKEMEEYKFSFDRKWYTEVLKDPSGEEYLFYLSKGDHEITMTVKMGSLTPVILSLNNDSVLLSNIIRDIIKITGSNPDPNYDYEFFKTIPNLKNDMETLIKSLQNKYDILKKISHKTPYMANNFLTVKSQLVSMIRDPFSIARRMNDLNSALTSLGAWQLSIQNQPLIVDYFYIGAPGDKLSNNRSNIFQKIKVTLENFLISFKKDYRNVGGVLKNNIEVNTVIDVWISRGTEWAELIKEMADEEFTTKTGIMVNINVLPASQLHAGNVNALMLSIISGETPDVAMGVDPGSPVEFAIRNAVYDLSKFEDFEKVSKRFIPNTFIPYRYKGGVYALPETMDFTVMFYRKDITNELGIKIPDSREDLYNHVLSILHQNGLQFYYPPDFTQFIYQHGGDYYTPDGKKSALDKAESFRAFKECSELYTNYGIPVVSSFFNRIRTGEMPMGIGSYSFYMQLSVAAPELAGKWDIALLPGLKKSDGSIDRSNGALTGQGDIILKNSKHPKEAWEFLKWWTSTSVQTDFAREVEALIGSEARWNTANVEAFSNLPWKKEHLNVIKEQWKWSKEIPVVLGGYFTGRHLNNAWNRVIINGQKVRDALEEAVEDINRELQMKQEEYGELISEE